MMPAGEIRTGMLVEFAFTVTIVNSGRMGENGKWQSCGWHHKLHLEGIDVLGDVAAVVAPEIYQGAFVYRSPSPEPLHCGSVDASNFVASSSRTNTDPSSSTKVHTPTHNRPDRDQFVDRFMHKVQDLVHSGTAVANNVSAVGTSVASGKRKAVDFHDFEESNRTSRKSK